MNNNEKSYMHVALVLDASGSMAGIRNTTVESLKKFFKGFASEEDKTILDVWQFNDKVRHIVDGADLAKGAPETLEGYETDGCTALYDAVCVGIDELGRKLAAMPEAERPDGVAFAILTDGFENVLLHPYKLLPAALIMVLLMVSCHLVAEGLKKAM